MRLNEHCLLDIVDAAQKIRAFVGSMDRAAFEAAPQTQAAVLYEILVIGEAVKLLSEEWRDQHPSIPWKQVARMRDRMIHSYFNVKLDIVWGVVTNDIPAMIAYLTPLIPPET